MNTAAALIMPAFIVIILVHGMVKGVPVFDVFTKGAKEGIKIVLSLAPVLVGLLTAVAMFRSSGALELLADFMEPLLAKLGIPAEIIPLAILRPVSGSGSISLFTGIVEAVGPDSLAGRIAAVVLASTETTFYTMAVYYGACGIKKSGYTLPAALIGDTAGFLFAVLFVKLFFY